MTFKKKAIDVTIQLGSGQFGNQKGDTLTLTGHRVIIDYAAFHGNSTGTLQARIYGIPLDIMLQLTTIGPINSQYLSQNKITLNVGNVGEPLLHLFTGNIMNSYADLSDSPNAALNVIALGQQALKLTPCSATSFKGPASIDTILNGVINNINIADPLQKLSLRNEGVKAILTDGYFPGTGYAQIDAIVKAARCAMRIDDYDSYSQLVIWPLDKDSNEIQVILTPQSDPGIVGYPTFSSNGVVIKSTFVNVGSGYLIKIEDSLLTPANRTFIVQQSQHSLSSELPGGPWYSTFLGTPLY